MSRVRFLLLCLALPVMSAAGMTTPASARPATRVQALVLDAVIVHMHTAGPATQVGHRQVATGVLYTARGSRAGRFRFTCTWTRIEPHGAVERCTASALTGDGRLDAAGPARSDRVTHDWAVSGGTGAYRGARGSVIVRDLTDHESLLSARITTHGHAVLAVGRVNRPAVNRNFTAHADRLCQAAAQRLATLPAFPLPTFDPLHPDPAVLPTVGAFFTGPGDPRPVLRALNHSLRGMGRPAGARGTWRSVLRAREQQLTIIGQQDRAALAADVPAFVHSVHESAANFRELAIAATVFGITRCIL